MLGLILTGDLKQKARENHRLFILLFSLGRLLGVSITGWAEIIVEFGRAPELSWGARIFINLYIRRDARFITASTNNFFFWFNLTEK